MVAAKMTGKNCETCASASVCDAYDPMNKADCGAWVDDPEEWTSYTPDIFKEGDDTQSDIQAATNNEAEYLGELVRWAYGQLHSRTFSDMDDALMLDRMKLYLEHGHAG